MAKIRVTIEVDTEEFPTIIEQDVRYTLMDALYGFQECRRNAETYVSKGYGKLGWSQETLRGKVAEVSMRVQLAEAMRTGIEVETVFPGTKGYGQDT